MRLQKLYIFNYRNYLEAKLNFDEKITCFLGNNGSGKTNLLDAIHMLSMTKSAFGLNDALNIRHGESGFSVKGMFSRQGQMNEVRLSLQNPGKKQLVIDDQPQTKYAEHIGNFPVIVISPYDTDLIRDGAESRRKFLDSTLSQIDPAYLNNLINYNRALKQRNALLKSFAEGKPVDNAMLEVYNEQLAGPSSYIYTARRNFVEKFIPVFTQIYTSLSDNSIEDPCINYTSDLSSGTDLKELLQTYNRTDILLQRTTKGIHKDDLDFLLNGYDLKKFGSQGQQKCFVIALKLSQFIFIKKQKGHNPIILLDDIFDKLDEQRINQLLEFLGKQHDAQLFITDARSNRTQEIFHKLGMKADFRFVEKGIISEL
ncbi:MAG TPA: DNA replication/repair protein RecF [Cyclobacteriaceae bacterium]|nr:DNA replication/repair protein RecF [Cyclobacteriaceae bacterium]